MRIVMDASGAAKPKRTGIARYIASLVEAILRVDPRHELVLAVRLSRWKRRAHVLRPVSPNARVRWFQEPFTGWIRRGADVVHGPDLRLPRVRDVPLVSTVHDAFSLTSEAFANEAFREKKRRQYRDVADRAAALLTVSRASRDRLVDALDLPPERVRVVPLGVDARFRPVDAEDLADLRRRHDLPDRYVLFVGQISRRKNLPRLVEAFDRLASQRPDLHLVLAGRLSFGAEDTVDACASSPVADRIRRTDHFPDEDLPGLYAAASAVVLPSLDEGFGLPTIEAMACGTPVVASDAGALPEVTGGAARLVDPEDAEALAGALESVLDDATLREDLVARGLRRAAELTWDRCAERTLEVYEEVARS
jgi:alpha-1,3-rhamnosyl/mannosyltransferase